MSLRAVIAVLVVAVAAAVPAGATGDETRPLRVLFIGNSLTAANDLPAVVAALGTQAHTRPIVTGTVAVGGFNLEDHWTLGDARAALAAAAWDVVVLQQGPSALPESRVNLREWAQRWADEVRAHGARPALLTVWPESYRRSFAFGDVIRSYLSAAAAARATVLPAGVAWKAAWRRDARLPLYGPDGFHPSRLGTYLAAIVCYSRLTGVSPLGLPVPPGTKPATARVLRQAALEALRT